MSHGQDPNDLSRSLRQVYEAGETYPVEVICREARTRAHAYADRLLQEKLSTIIRHRRPGLLLDVCCATGEHLFAIAEPGADSVGIDFTFPYVAEAMRRAVGRAGRFGFAVGDATRLPLCDASVGTAYCLSALYALPDARSAVAEIARVLSPGGTAILDFGNRRSLNDYCLRFYPEWPQTFRVYPTAMESMCRDAGLRIIERRYFQLLPLWAGRPQWLWPLLHPAWQNLLRRRLFGRMLDEWLSSMPLLRRYAFRYLLVVEKCSEP